MTEVSSSAAPDRRRALLRIGAYGLAVFGIPALWRKSLPDPPKPGEDGEGDAGRLADAREDTRLLEVGKLKFAKSPLRRMEREKPEYLFMGDSMAKAFVDPGIITDLTRRRCSVLYLPGSTSARWYLMLKNYVIASGVRPRVVFLLFRDCLWSMPGYRVQDAFWDEIERCMPEDSDPVITKILGSDVRGSSGRLEKILRERVYPLQTATPYVTAAIDRAAACTTGEHADQLREWTNDLFSFENSRRGPVAQMVHDGLDDFVPFSADPDHSFLPHVVELARRENLKLHFIRVKRRPRRLRLESDTPELKAYVADMRAWLASQQIGLHDMTDDPELTPDKYGEGDHLAPEYQDWYTRRLAGQLREVLV